MSTTRDLDDDLRSGTRLHAQASSEVVDRDAISGDRPPLGLSVNVGDDRANEECDGERGTGGSFHGGHSQRPWIGV
jgi:hypothetical protein